MPPEPPADFGKVSGVLVRALMLMFRPFTCGDQSSMTVAAVVVRIIDTAFPM
jgi:hypothetical protein